VVDQRRQVSLITVFSFRAGYALTMQQGGQALRALGLGDLLGEHGAISTKHVSYRADGARLGAYGLTRRKAADSGAVTSPGEELSDERSCGQGATGACDANEGLMKTKTRHNVHIPRQRLREIMLQSIDSSSILWGKKLNDLVICDAGARAVEGDESEQTQTERPYVCVSFEDGTSYELSALIGADGIYSSVRQELLRASTGTATADKLPAARDVADGLRYLGLMVILGISPNSAVDDADPGLSTPVHEQRQWLDGETRVFSMPYDKHHTMWQLSYPCSEDDAVQLASTYQQPPQSGPTGAVVNPLLDEALRRCDGWAPNLTRLLRASDPRLVSGHPVYDRDPDSLNLVDRLAVDHLATDNIPEDAIDDGKNKPSSVKEWPITLIGDAAHPMSPFKGQGANQAILDALALSRAISMSNLFEPVKDTLLGARTGGTRRAGGRRSVAECLRQYEAEMYRKSAEKVQRSRDAAYYLHSKAALAEGNVTRAKAAEDFVLSTKADQ
jgi:salicylate hydroxylase